MQNLDVNTATFRCANMKKNRVKNVKFRCHKMKNYDKVICQKKPTYVSKNDQFR